MKIAHLLEDMLNQKTSMQTSIIELEKCITPKYENIFSYLEHYFADEDIREEDIEYKDFQNNELEKLISYLKMGDFEEANEISFLAVTPNIMENNNDRKEYI